jgi:phosphatidylserine/phosphatidylglycerophosphate/cardiolipin synthase-like enzyme
LIVSPWINSDVVDDEMLINIKDAVKRGVWILIGYGMPLRHKETKEDYIDSRVSDQFKNIQKTQEGKHLVLLWLGNTHEKILVCDNVFSVVTSHNWLSYRGDRGFRSETGTYSEDPRIISETIKHVLSEFKYLPDGFPLKEK